MKTLEASVAKLRSALERQAAEIEKVSQHVEAAPPVPQLAAND